jgi:hypothetical protein
MKASTEYVEKMRKAVSKHDTTAERKRYFETYVNDPITDMDTLYRWDTLWSAVDSGDYTYDDLQSEDLDDAHIDTVLKTIIPRIVI